MSTQPPAGKRVLVTRAVRQASKLSEGLSALGAEPVEVPVLEICAPNSFAPLDQALRQLDQYNWLILTSANTVRALTDRAAALGLQLTAAPGLRVAAIGEATASAARKAGLPVALVPESYVAESLVKALLHHSHEVSGYEIRNAAKEARRTDGVVGHGLSRTKKAPNDEGALAPGGNLYGQRILLARAEIARDLIPDALRATGAQVDVVDAYRNVMPANAPDLLRHALSERIDAATFTSSSSVTHLAEAAREAGIAFPFAGVQAISIGPITSQTLRELGWEPATEATVSDIAGLIEAIQRAFH